MSDLEFFRVLKILATPGEKTMHPGWLIMVLMLFKITFLTTFIPIIKLYNTIIKLFSLLGENIKKILGLKKILSSFTVGALNKI